MFPEDPTKSFIFANIMSKHTQTFQTQKKLDQVHRKISKINLKDPREEKYKSLLEDVKQLKGWQLSVLALNKLSR